MARLLRPYIPDPCLRLVRNLTPFPSFQCDKMGPGRTFHDTVVVKGTFDLKPGVPTLAQRQAPIALADEYWDATNATRSSIKQAGDALLAKPSTDIIVTGTARSHRGRAAREWDTTLVVHGSGGPLLSHGLRATGPRRWEHRPLRGWRLTDPEPAVEVPIRYELAYGGAYPDPAQTPQDGRPHRWCVYKINPSGSGYWDEQLLDRSRSYAGPQWQPLDSPAMTLRSAVPLSGFGPVSRSWSSRLQYAGTYDDAWEMKARTDASHGLPVDYPSDFNLTFFQCAHPSLITTSYLRGDERIVLGGFTAHEAVIELLLPGIAIHARLLRLNGQWVERRLPLDTIHIDLDTLTIRLSWRLTLDQSAEVHAAIIHNEVER